ncbi:MAG: lipoprotein-releasing system ATP-binding protein LolD [Candidatus Aenigmarchaeota archaeon ex4484_52]|nr:MAG: lipoprotein-releasing system ATP-binding protein LolD [Candidatus Aenigmarchaeota archaeon ex4484_52]
MKKNILIKLENVWKIYKIGKVEIAALRGVNIGIEKKEFVAVMGPSGSGKSTCVNLIGCLDKPTKGQIYLGGENINNFSRSRLSSIRGEKIGFVFQQFNLINTLSILENVMLPMIFYNIDLNERITRAKKILEKMGLSNRLNHYPNEISGGEKQRVAIARSLANNPDIIIADEPTGNLDSKKGKEIMEILEKLHKMGKTIVLVTHDKILAEFAKRIIYIKDGKNIEI